MPKHSDLDALVFRQEGAWFRIVTIDAQEITRWEAVGYQLLVDSREIPSQVEEVRRNEIEKFERWQNRPRWWR